MTTVAGSRRRRLAPQHRRELIRAGAMRVFAERGYAAASMTEIARAAGVTPAVIYDHFESKAELQVELLELQTDDLLTHVGTALQEAPSDQGERMRAGVDAFFAFVETNRFTWRMLFRDPPSDPQVADAYARLEDRATAAIALFIEASAEGSLDRYAQPARAATMFAEALKAAQNGLASWWYDHPEVSRQEIVERLLDFCWTGLAQLASPAPGGAR